MGGDECKLWILGSASYQQVASKLEMVDSIGGGIKVEFGGFIGGFGKIFFYKRRDKERERGFWDGRKGRRREFIFFLKFSKGWRRVRNFIGECIFGLWIGKGKRKGGKG